MRRLVDSHVHIDSLPDPELIYKESITASVDAVICVGGDIESSKHAIKAASLFSDFSVLSECISLYLAACG